MDLIVDANVVFSALIKDSTTAKLLINENLHLFAPEFLFEEVLEHNEEILRKTKRTKEELKEIIEILEMLINIVPKEEFGNFLPRAEKICPDKDDVSYFALALRLNCALWSNDKELKNQEVVPVYSTEDLLRIAF